MQLYSKVVLKKGKEDSLLRFHPWIFSGAIDRIDGQVEEGDTVSVFTAEKQLIGYGHCAIGSIAVRMISFGEQQPDDDFWVSKLSNALSVRETAGLTNRPDTNVFRLVHGEGDGMPGLVVDFYNGTAVFQAHSVGMWLNREKLVAALQTVMGNKLVAVYDKSSKTLPYKASVEPADGYLLGHSQSTEVLEYGNRFLVDWEEGQKTGFFIDQRENRKLLREYSKGRDVLNMFCYTGGFSFYAMRGGAKSVTSVDSSAKAIELTNQNVEMNFPGDNRHSAYVDDAFKFMEEKGDGYDLIILDPPAFAKHRAALHNALKGYTRLNLKALEKIKKGGILFTFSCSQVVTKDNFRNAVFTAAAQAHRRVRILHQLHQPADHPINIYHPEGEYLKGLVLYVE